MRYKYTRHLNDLKDLKHIEKFKDFIGLDNKISYREKTKSYRYSFKSIPCKADLIKQGCVPKKSLILKFPSEQQENLVLKIWAQFILCLYTFIKKIILLI